MKLVFSILFLFVTSITTFSQSNPSKFDSLIKVAKEFYFAQNYESSASTFSEAFKESYTKTNSFNYYFSACSFAKLKDADNSIKYFKKYVDQSQYSMYDEFIKDSTWYFLNSDVRWKSILDQIKENQTVRKKNFELYKDIISDLAQIELDDQTQRNESAELGQKYGVKSVQMDSIWKLIKIQDSINLLKVTTILDKYGWMGSNEIGYEGGATMWIVLQHSDLKTQEKYLPIMKTAFENEKLDAGSIAMIEDRINIRSGRKQLYGSQLAYDEEMKTYYLSPVEDPDNLDKRREKMDLGSIGDYLSNWGIKWNLEEYKKNLPRYIELQKKAGNY